MHIPLSAIPSPYMTIPLLIKKATLSISSAQPPSVNSI